MSLISKISFAVLLVLFLAYNSAYAQEESQGPSFRFEHINLPNGDLGNHVQIVVQDSFGYLWFGSQYGLHRWDGYQFKTYINDPLDTTSISSSYIETIYIAKDSTIWIGTWGAGLNQFDPQTETFTRYQFDKNNPNSVSNDFINKIIEDRDGNLWVTTQIGINRFDRSSKLFKRFLHDPTDSTSLSYNQCRTAFMDSDGILWFGTGWVWGSEPNGGLNRYHPKTESFTRYLHDPEDPSSLLSNKVFEIFEDSKGNFWIGTEGDGLHLMDRKTGTFTRLQNDNGSLSAPYLGDFMDDHVKLVFEDHKQKLWIGSWQGGLKYYDPSTKQSQHYHVGKQSYTMPENNIWDMMQTEDGTLFCWTAGPDAKVFKIVEEKLFMEYIGIAAGGSVQTFFEEDDGTLWIGTDRYGLVIKEPNKKYWQSYTNDPNKSAIIHSDTSIYNPTNRQLFDDISKTVQDGDGNLWFILGSYWNNTSGIMRMHPKTRDYKHFKFKRGDPSSISHPIAMDMIADKKGRIWILGGDGVLNLFNPSSQTFEQFKVPFSKTLDNTTVVSVMNLTQDGKIWIGGGITDSYAMVPVNLFRFDPEIKSFESFDPKVKVRCEYSVGFVQDIHEDSKGNVWFVTPKGIHRFDPTSENFKTWPTQKFGSYRLRGFIIDDEDVLWCLGKNLVLFNPETETSFMYSSGNGIRTLPFSKRGIYKSLNGNVYVGGRGGFHFFTPKNILGNSSSKKPKLLITDFLLPDEADEVKSFSLFSQTFQENPTIKLRHDQNVFSFRFATLDYLQPQYSHHEFMLEGYDDTWRKTGFDPSINYIKVPPGEYTFKVRAANYLGVWSDTKSIKLIISPPWWKTWWAYSLYALAGLCLIFGFYRFQLTRQLAHSEAKRLKELNDTKTLLYTNITHEFRTPLTVILGMARQVLDDPKVHFRNGMDMIVRNGENLLSLVNQMLDLSKLESGKMSLNFIQSDVVNFLKYLSESFHSYAESHGIQIHFLSDVEQQMMDYDAEKLQQVVLNLLSNAVKFTEKGGHVYLSVGQTNESEIFIKVKDTGKGIPEEELENIFNRFYQVDDSITKESQGSGIGLALTKELINLMDGEIAVKSQTGKGAEFIITLPIRQTADLSNQIKPVFNGSKLQAPKEKLDQVPLTNGAVDQKVNRILLIEDNPDVVQYLTSCLATDYRLHIATDGQEGVDMATEIIPDLIISDIMMPKKDGFEVCDILKEDERTSHIPIIMLTAKADIESKIEGLQKGADAYLEKPFHKTELLVRIKKLLELREKLQVHYRNLLTGSNFETGLQNEIPNTIVTEDYFVKKVRKVIEENMDNFDLSVEMLCKEIAMSNSQLHRKLSALTGLSATKFIRYIRLNHAKELLSNQELSITAVAFDTGFNDPSYFGRVFKKEFGLTPMEWREMERVE